MPAPASRSAKYSVSSIVLPDSMQSSASIRQPTGNAEPTLRSYRCQHFQRQPDSLFPLRRRNHRLGYSARRGMTPGCRHARSAVRPRRSRLCAREPRRTANTAGSVAGKSRTAATSVSVTRSRNPCRNDSSSRAVRAISSCGLAQRGQSSTDAGLVAVGHVQEFPVARRHLQEALEVFLRRRDGAEYSKNR